MPLYEYECDAHGTFEELRSLAEHRAPAHCPECGALGMRVVSATRASVMERSQVIARDRNERSRHEPRLVKHEHSASCGHGQRAPAPKSASKGLKAYTGKRPWVIEHG